MSPFADKLRTLVRSEQTRLPWLPDVKASAQRAVTRALQRPFEKDFSAIPLLGLPAGSLFLDVGANRGQSIDAIRMVADEPCIESFEPNTRLAARLTARYAGVADVDIHHFGLGDEPGSFRLHTPSYRNYVFDGLASFDEEAALSWLPSRIRNFDERHMSVVHTRCEVRRLDDLDLEPAFIKLDVQGFEQRTLLGGERTVREFRPVLLIEDPTAATVEYLEGLDYRMHGFHDGELVPDRLGDLNTFFLA